MHGATADGSVAFRRKLRRGKLLSFLASQSMCTAMEACASAHHSTLQNRLVEIDPWSSDTGTRTRGTTANRSAPGCPTAGPSRYLPDCASTVVSFWPQSSDFASITPTGALSTKST